jgi:hypothetical protein
LSQASAPCDVAVEVKSAVFSGGSARFILQPIGQPRLEGQPRETKGKKWRCREFPAETSLAISGLRGTTAEALTSEASRVLLTVESYLQAHGIRFDRPPAADPKQVADAAPNAGGEAHGRLFDHGGPARLLASIRCIGAPTAKSATKDWWIRRGSEPTGWSPAVDDHWAIIMSGPWFPSATSRRAVETKRPRCGQRKLVWIF